MAIRKTVEARTVQGLDGAWHTFRGDPYGPKSQRRIRRDRPDHPKRLHGLCSTCGHYGSDCTGGPYWTQGTEAEWRAIRIALYGTNARPAEQRYTVTVEIVAGSPDAARKLRDEIACCIEDNRNNHKSIDADATVGVVTAAHG